MLQLIRRILGLDLEDRIKEAMKNAPKKTLTDEDKKNLLVTAAVA
jgi:hypothetical protein